MDFKDKVVVISGSSQGIGKATAQAFLSLGCKVVINGRKKETLMKTHNELAESGGNVFAVKADVSNPAEAKQLINKTFSKYGRIDILINNAGFSMRGKIEDLDPIVFQQSFTVNVLGTANLTIYALPYIKQSKGSIVFISSLAGVRGLPGLSAYCSSKLALQGIAESLRIEEAQSGIHVGLVQISQTEVDQNKVAMDATGEMVPLPDRSHLKVTPKVEVVKAILNNIRKREFITTMTLLGKLNVLMQSLAPGLLEKILIKNIDRILARSV
ncbi:MAG: SDR family oxidoreductase [Bacteroidota bacterium]